MFLGANIDAVAEAGRFGIRGERAVNYKALSKGVSCVRSCVDVKEIDVALECWDEEICKDYSRRKK